MIKFVGDTKLERIANALDSRIAMQKRSDRLKQWTRSNKIMLNGDKCKALHLVKINKQIHGISSRWERCGLMIAWVKMIEMFQLIMSPE